MGRKSVKAPITNSEPGLKENIQTLGKLRVLSELLTRSRLASQLGVSFGGARDLYEVLGYKRDLKFQDYWDMFERGRLGARIVCAPVTSSWYGNPGIYETQDPEETDFEKAWKDLNDKLQLIPKLIRLDILAGIGQYGTLLMGYDDGLLLDQPFLGKHNLIYIQPYHEDNSKILEWEKDSHNPRYGKPVIYQIGQANTTGVNSSSIPPTPVLRVHWTRILHVAEGCLENDVFGTPRLRPVYNSVSDVEKIVGGSAEMFWQGALGGKAFKTQEGFTIDADTIDTDTEIDEYIHGLRRYLKLNGLDVQDLSPDVASPKEHVDVQLDMISGLTGIPKRILVGSEAGELASSQDEGNWNSRVQQRREQFVGPFIIRPFVDKLIDIGVLPTPKEGYQIEWPPLSSMAETERATVAKTKTEALVAYSSAPGVEQVMPPEFFLEEVLGFTSEQVERIQEMVAELPEPEPLPEEPPVVPSTPEEM